MQAHSTESDTPVKAIIVGAGQRSLVYASYALRYPGQMQIVGIVEPDPVRRRHAADKFQIPADRCFETVEQLTAQPGIAGAAINGTMDALHVSTTLPLLQHGYDVLLEKPIGVSEEEILQLRAVAKTWNRKVMICHVLRYAPFYTEIRKRVVSGEIGDIIHIQTEENVSYHHMATGFVRGKWSQEDTCKSTMLMAKCCHDMDILTWMKGGIAPARVNSFGNLMHFRPERAPESAGTRCLVDCAIESECPYSARKLYVEKGMWKQYAWRSIEHLTFTPTEEQKLESLRTDNPYGRCVWRSENDVVDHQTVIVQFEDGSTASHNMVGGTAKPCRTIHIIGTLGEISGVMEDGCFVVRHPDPNASRAYREETVTLHVSNDMHGGGDLRLVEDFVRILKGEAPSISTTSLDDSIYGHMIGFRADRAREQGVSVPLEKL